MFVLQQAAEEVNSSEEVEVDIDELLDMENDEERRRHLQVITLLFVLEVSKHFDSGHKPPKTNLNNKTV